MRRLLECLPCVLLVVALSAADHYEDHYGIDASRTIGGAVTSRDTVDTSRPGQHGVIIPQPLLSIARTGILTNWTVHLRGTIGRVRLQIWRPMYSSIQSGELLFYSLIGQTDFKDVTSLGNGTRTFSVWPKYKIRLAPNDTYGLEFVDANIVTYSVSSTCKINESSVMWTRSLRAASQTSRQTFVPGQQYEFSRSRPPECRTYSVQLQLQIQECKRLRASTSGQVEQIFRAQRQDADVCWLVAPSDVRHITRLQVLQERSLDTVLVNNCSFVSMEIRIGQPAITGNLVFSHCDIEHHEIPFDVSNKEIYIRLVTSESHDYPEQLAISMAYSSKSLERNCEAVTCDENPSYIQSPGFPSAYPRNQDVCWLVTVGAPSRVRVEVQQSELEPSYSFTNDSSGCVDYVEIFDEIHQCSTSEKLAGAALVYHTNRRGVYQPYKVGASETQPMLARWCGTTDPGMLTASGSNILIRFYSGPYTAFPGFRLAVWAAGEADSRTCTSLQASNEEQYLYSPGYPHAYGSDENACWVLRASINHRVEIKVYDSNLEGDNLMCEYDVVIIRDGSHTDSAVLRRWCGTMVPHEPVVTTGSAAHVSLYSDGSISGPGFYLGFSQVYTDACTVFGVYPYSLELSAFRLFTRSPSSECFTLETELPNYRVRLELISPLRSGSCNRDYIAVYDGPGQDSEELVRWCNGVTTPTYVTSSAASLHVRATIGTVQLQEMDFRFAYLGLVQGKTPPLCAGPGQCRRLQVGRTGGVLNSPTSDMHPYATPGWGGQGPATPPGRRPVTARSDPSSVKYTPNADVCTVLEGSASGLALVLHIVFVQIEGPDNTGTCSNDYLEIRDGDSETSPLLVKQCGERSSLTLITSGRFAYIRFVSNADLQFRGFQIRFTANVTQASGCTVLDVTPSGGLLTSPDYPDPYPSMADVCWVLTAPVSSHVQLDIVEFFVEEGCLDYLEIYDGERVDSNLLTLLCGDGKAPDVVTSTGQSLYLRFRSDNGIQYRGFRIKYKTASSGICQHIAVGPSTKSISSPNWPLSMPRSAEFCWVLTTPGHAEHLLVTVSDSELLDSPTCTKEFVELLDGPLPSSPPILRWCSDNVPTDMTTTGRSAYLHLVTTSSNSSSKGFVINFKSISIVSAASAGSVVQSLNSNIHWVIIAAIFAFMFLIIFLASLCYFYKRNRKRTRIPPPIPTSTSNGNAIYDVPTMVHGAQGTSHTPPAETKGVWLNPDGSASYSTAFENPGYAELPPPT